MSINVATYIVSSRVMPHNSFLFSRCDGSESFCGEGFFFCDRSGFREVFAGGAEVHTPAYAACEGDGCFTLCEQV